jgi:hypothetical protein
MTRVCIVCEGPTEARFIQQCLVPYLAPVGVYVYGSVIQAPSGRHKGGRVTIERLARHLSHEYHAFDRLTTLVDFYGFQDRAGRTRAQLEADIANAAQAITSGYDPRYVLPYVQMYEFEGLLFTDPAAFEWVQDGWNEDVHQALSDVARMFESPELINDSPETAPSKRLLKIFANGTYSKTEHGPLVAESIGIEAIRRKCPAFSKWVAKLQTWGGESRCVSFATS